MSLREFFRYHFLKALLALVIIQIAIIVFVQSFNHKPVAEPDITEVIEGRTVKITPLSNDSDKDELDELALKSVSSPLHGKIEQKMNILYYIPNNGYTGKDSLLYTVTDGDKESKGAYITIQVNKNHGPIANRDFSEVYTGGNVSIDVLHNDEDREGDSIFIKEFSQPANGRVSLKDKRFVYSAMNTTALVDSFSYTVSDGKSNSKKAFVQITIKGENDPCYPWLSSDIGNTAINGSFSCVNRKFVIIASGGDIWEKFDGFRYAYQFVEGDCEMYAKIDSLKGAHEWTKAGLMIREDLGGDSKMAFICLTSKNGSTIHQRINTGESVEGGNTDSEINAPYWVKIARKGNSFSYSISADGNNWKKLGDANVPMSKKVYIGFALTSHNNEETSRVVFDKYRMIGKTAKIY